MFWNVYPPRLHINQSDSAPSNPSGQNPNRRRNPLSERLVEVIDGDRQTMETILDKTLRKGLVDKGVLRTE
jgi:hypothetical protein